MNAHPFRTKQHGAALMILVLLLVMGGLTYLLSGLSSEGFNSRRERQTQETLAQAREALIGYALQYREQQPDEGHLYGYLPLPDLGSTRNNNAGCTGEGCDAAYFPGITFDARGIGPTIIGRFPWQTIGTEPFRDSHGECLWLIVSSLHSRIQRASPPATPPPMNWDTLGQLDVVIANGSNALNSTLASAHDRPVAIIFSPGPALPGQNRAASSPATDDVTKCGGNYDARNYLDPATAVVTNFLGGTNAATGATGDSDLTNDPDAPKALTLQGKVMASGGNLWPNACTGGNCATVANDLGLPLTSDALFGAIRKHAYFRTDINSLLDRVTSCLRDSPGPAGYAKIAGANNDPCYGDGVNPLGYYSNYREMLFVATGPMTVNGDTCTSVLLFGNQRNAAQQRITLAQKNAPGNYLEDINLTSYTDAGTSFSGDTQIARVNTQLVSKDIIRCIPSTSSFVTVGPTITALGGPLATYDPGTRTLILGQEVTAAESSDIAVMPNNLFGCAWTPESHAMNGGLRSYFKFRINDSNSSVLTPLDGFSFSIIDGDINGSDVCGAAAQHIGYSGRNGSTQFIAPPKIALEIDQRSSLNSLSSLSFDPSDSDTLGNGRNDPVGNHQAIVYWGGDSSITTTASPPCAEPRVNASGTCQLPQEEDDNVHGTLISGVLQTPVNQQRANFPLPPLNPSPATPDLFPADFENKNIHVRIELTREPADFLLPAARVATTGSINRTLPGNIIDDVPLLPDDRILVKDQAVASENGLYVWRGPAVPLIRAADADSSTDLSGLILIVEQGILNANTLWRQAAIEPAIDTGSLRWARHDAKVATQLNINLSAPGASIDNIRLSIGDRVLVKAQTLASENGIYSWNGAALAMTRTPDNDTEAEVLGVVVQIQRGSEATAWWRFDGTSWQRIPKARVATQSAINLGSPDDNAGDGIDGIDKTPLIAGDRVLVRKQANPAENGVYLWTNPATPMTRTSDADSSSELAGALLQVLEGSDSGRTFRQTTLLASGLLNTDAVSWVTSDASPRYQLEIWIRVGDTFTNQIAAMKNTTRPMSLLYPGFSPHIRKTPTIPYPFRRARFGFTTGQRTTVTDQTISITDIFTSWMP